MAASYRRKFFHSFLTVDKEGKMKKSVRKTLSLILVIITVLALFAQPAFAISQKLLDEIDKTNEQIFKEVEKTQEKAEKEALKGKSREKFEEYLDGLIEKLFEKTEKLADKLIKKAAKEGVTLSKTYIEVLIYDRVILVDPFYAH
jgi:predicted PurR-regulated permease PerM